MAGRRLCAAPGLPDPPRLRLAIAVNDRALERAYESVDGIAVLAALRTTTEVQAHADLPADAWVLSQRLPGEAPLPAVLAGLPAGARVLILAGRWVRGRALAEACAARTGCRLLGWRRASGAALRVVLDEWMAGLERPQPQRARAT